MKTIKELIDVMKSDTFLKELDRLGGYEYPNIGKVIRADSSGKYNA